MARKRKRLFIPVVVAMAIGALLTTIGFYQNPILVCLHAQKDPAFSLRVVQELLNTNEKLRDTVAVLATSSATQFGKRFCNTLAPAQGRDSVIAHPYDKQGSGVSVTVTYTDAQTGVRKILLMRKLNERGHPEKGVQEALSFIGGYTHGAPVEGSRASSLSFEEEEIRDAVEDAFVADPAISLRAVQRTENSPSAATALLTRKDLDKLGEAIKRYHTEAVIQDPYVRALPPEKIKNYLASQGLSYTNDFNHIDAALREFREESGYKGELSPEQMQVVFVGDDYGVTNAPYLHTVVFCCVLDLGRLDAEPTIYPSAYQSARPQGTFQPNGTKVGELHWAALEKIHPDKEGFFLYEHFNISPTQGAVYQNIVRFLRDQELAEISQGLLESRKALATWGRLFGLPVPASTHGELGEAAAFRHQQDLLLAKKIQQIARSRKILSNHPSAPAPNNRSNENSSSIVEDKKTRPEIAPRETSMESSQPAL